MLSMAGRNAALDGGWPASDFLSAHETYPGDTGTGETSGGTPTAYIRKQGTYSPATGGIKALAAGVTFDIAVGKTIRYIGRWSAVTGGIFKGCLPLGGTEKEFTADATTDIVTCSAHGYVQDQKICFINGGPPGPLVEGDVYFCRMVGMTANTFQVAASIGGAAINLTSTGVVSCVVSAIFEEVFSTQGTLTPNTFAQGLNG